MIMQALFKRRQCLQSFVWHFGNSRRRISIHSVAMSRQIMLVERPMGLCTTSLHVPERLLTGPGPSNAPESVLKAMTAPLLGHLHPEFLKIMDDVKEGLRYLFQTTTRVVCCVSGTGHAGMETVINNLLEEDEVFLIGQNGVWGERMLDIATRQGISAKLMSKDVGSAFSLDELEMNLNKFKPKAVFLVHVESSTGVIQPLERVGHLCHKYGALLIVDTVASLGGAPFFMDEWEVDVAYSGSQKVLGAPPSLAPIAFSELAMEKVAGRKKPPRSFYFDINELANYWGCDTSPRRYHHTGPISSIYALREALALAAKEGLQEMWHRHLESTRVLHEGLIDLQLSLFVGNPDLRSPTITTIDVPHGVPWKKLSMLMMQRYGIEMSGGLGPTLGKVWRIGLMGQNSSPQVVSKILQALRKVLEEVRLPSSNL